MGSEWYSCGQPCLLALTEAAILMRNLLFALPTKNLNIYKAYIIYINSIHLALFVPMPSLHLLLLLCSYFLN